MRCLSYAVLLVLFGFSKLTESSTRGKCTPLNIKLCRKLGYNETRPLEDIYRSTPIQELRRYIKMIDRIQCSPDALFFLCTVYSPVCFQQYTTRVLPCRSVCKRVKRGCMPFVQLAGFSWPSELDCQGFPEYNTGVCIRPSAIVSSSESKEAQNIEDSHFEKDPNLGCSKCSPQQELKRYKQFKGADYVIEAEVKSRITTGEGQTKVIVRIKRVFKRRTTKINKGIYSLVSPTRCLCPEIEFDKAVLIVGREDKGRKELLFDSRTIVATISKQLKRKVRKWSKKYRKYMARKNLRGRKKSLP